MMHGSNAYGKKEEHSRSVVVFDLDGTLLRDTAVSVRLAHHVGRAAEIIGLEQRYRSGEISNTVVAEGSAATLGGYRPDELRPALTEASWIGGIEPTLSALRAGGCALLLATVTWRFAAELVARELGFDATCGTEMSLDPDGRLTGRVSRFFDEFDKAEFVRAWCAARGVGMDRVAAIGDSRSDVPLFEAAGYAIALNATADARSAADVRLDTGDLRDVLPLLGHASAAHRQLEEILRGAPALMRALRAARAVDAPDWYIAAGAIRDAVWDALHGRANVPPRDVDLIFFDAEHLDGARDGSVEDALRRLEPDLPWQAKNQAAVHTWYPSRFGRDVPPFTNSAEATATIPETPACVGVRLLDDDRMLIVAPHGLRDLLDCVCRHNPTRVSAQYYEQRVAEKGWRERWPAMRLMPPRA